MKHGYILIVIVIFKLSILSCSLLEKNMSYKHIYNNTLTDWKDTPIKIGKDNKTNLIYIAEKDTIQLLINRGNSEDDCVFFGLPLIPIPIDFVFLQKKYYLKLDIDMHFMIKGTYTIDFSNIKFMINGQNIIYPDSILEYRGEKPGYHYQYVNAEKIPIGLNDALIASEYKYFRFYFKEKLRNIKYLEIHIGNINNHSDNKEIPAVLLKRKTKYKFYPIFIN
jgi:hypothetical protein